MDAERHEEENSGVHPLIWVAGAAGTAAGVAALVYSRRRRSRFEQARERIAQAAATARDQARPWMGGAAAAAAAAGAVLAYRQTRRPDPGERVQRAARRSMEQLTPWLSLAASTAMAVASAASNSRERERLKKRLGKQAQGTAASVAGTGLRLLARVQRISGETRKLYPSVRRLIA